MKSTPGKGGAGAGRLVPVLLLTAALLAAAGPLAAQGRSGSLPPGNWYVLREGPWVVYHEPSERDAALGLVQLYEENIPDFARKLDLPMPDSVRVFIAPNQGRFRVLTRGLPDWTGGVAWPKSLLIVLPAPRMMDEATRFSVIALHEMVHILTDHRGDSHLPRWLSEGLAMYLSGETMYKHRRPLARAVVTGRTYTLEGIGDMLRLGPEQARVAYLQSISFVDFLVERYGWDAVAGLVKGYARGEGEQAMFEAISGRDLHAVEVAWHQKLRDRYRWWNLLQWVNFEMLLWTGAAMLAVFGGGLAIVRRKRYLARQSTGEDWDSDHLELIEGGRRFYGDSYDDPPIDPDTGEWIVDDDHWR